MRRLNAVFQDTSDSADAVRPAAAASPVASRPEAIAVERTAQQQQAARPATTARPIDWRRVRRSLNIAVPGLCLFAILCTVSWVWYTGRWDQLTYQARSGADASVAGLGLTVDKIILAREPKYTLKRDIRAAIGASEGGAIGQVPPSEVRENLLSLPWVENATVERRLPNILSIDIIERRPLAVWQEQAQFHLIDDKGQTILSDAAVQQFGGLPRLVGEGADEQALAILAEIDRHPGLSGKLHAAALVNRRRWDLYFQNGVRVLLPENGRETALQRLANLDKVDSLLDRDVIEVDLRLQDRMVIRRGDPASTGRDPGGIFSVLPSAKPQDAARQLGQPT